MGQYIGRNKLGTPALFIIKGDTPDPGEMAKIADILSGKGVQAEAPAPAPEEEPGILENIKGNALRGWNEMQAGIDFGMQGLKESQGDTQGAREWGDAARDQLAERDTYKVREKGFLEEEGIYNKIASLTGTAGRTAIGMAGGIGATIAGGAIGTAVGGPVGAVVGTGLGLAAGTAAYAPQMLSANAERQIEEHGYIKDFGKAFKATALQSGIESITDKITLKLGGIAYKGAKSAAKAAGFGGRAVTDPAIHEAVDKSIKMAMTEAAKRIGAPAAFGAVSGAAEEVMQQQLERWQAELPLMDADAKKEYLESAIVGGILEGVFGAGAGYIGHRQDTKTIKRLKAAAADVESETAARIQRATGSAAEHERLRQSRYEEPPPPPETEEQVRIAGLLPKPTGETREQIALRNLPPGLNEDETGAPPPPPSGPSFTNPLPDNFPAFEGERDVDNDSFRKALLQHGKTNKQESVDLFRDTEETRRAHKAQQPTKQEPIQGPSKPIYSENEYTETIDKLRDFKSISVDRIATEMKMPRPKAQAIFTEMLRRNDAYPSGSENQYAKITVPHGIPTRSGFDVRGKIPPKRSRDFIVKPVQRADKTPFGIEVAGKARKPRFATREQAETWIAKNIPKSKQAQVVEDQSGQQFGIHELHYQTQTNGEQHLIGERVVNTFQTREEADAAVKDYDPAYSPETNQRRTKMPVEEKESAIAADTLAELGPIEHQLQNAVNATVGAGRAQVDLVPKITRDYLRKLFPNVHDSRIPGEDAVVEGLHHTDPRALIKNVITLGADLNSPSLTEEQRTQLIQEVLNHELIHLIRSLNLLTNQEWNQLYRAALNQNIPGKQYTWAERAFIMQGPKSSTNAVMEEAIAEMFRTYIKDPTAFRNPERGILKKIADLIKKLIGLGRRHDAEDLMDMISQGGIADREVGHGGSRPSHEQEDIFYSLLKPDNFYLKTAQFIDGIKQAKAPAQQWKGMLKNAGIRQDEKEWLGLDEWLDSIAKDGPIEKKDIQSFIGASSGIEVKVLAHRNDPILGKAAVGRPEWGSMQSSGGEDYAEAVFIFRPKRDEPNYEGSHYVEDNVVAHARFKTIRDENGKKILFIEEIQSDLHQGADKVGGYYSESLKEAKEQAEREWREKDFISKNLFNKRTEAGHKLAVQRERLRINDNKIYAYEVGHALPPWGEPDPLPLLKQDRERLEDEIQALHGEFGRIDNAYKVAYDEANAKFRVIDKIRTRMWIPNAPFKTSWEDYVIKRMIRHGLEHDFDGIAWHGQPESVAETEKYPDFVTEEYESGPKYFVGKRDPESNEETRPNVTSIVNRYIQKLPRIVRALARKFGADIELNEASPDIAGPVRAKGSTAYIPPLLEYKYQIEAQFPSKDSLKSLFNKMKARQERELGFGHHTQAAEDQQNKLIDGMKQAYQIAINQRTFNPVKAFEDAGLIFENTNEADAYESDMLRDILIWTQPNATWADVNEARRGDVLGRAGVKPTSKGAFPWKHYQLNFNQPMKEAFEKGGIAKFSMLESRKQEIEADPNFQNWFNGSVVTEDDGSPKVVYHGTRADVKFGRFNRMSHFGTARAANDRLENERGFKKGSYQEWSRVKKDPPVDPNERIYPVFLNLRRPLKIRDNGLTYPSDYADAAIQARAISQRQFDRIVSISRGDSLMGQEANEGAAMDALIKILEKKGYDGFVYQNVEEDRGSTSYAAFHPTQIKSIFNRGSWDASNPDIDYSVLEARGAELHESNEKFQKWFRQSRVVNADGSPHLVFHGTTSDFDIFDEYILGEATEHPTAMLGFFFTSDPDIANSFAGQYLAGTGWPPPVKYARGSNIIPAFMRIENPYIMSGRQFFDLVIANSRSSRLSEIEDRIMNVRNLRHSLIKQGYDGIRIRSDEDLAGNMGGDEYGADAWVAFNTGQIKSALAEEFSTENDSFKFSVLEPPKYSATAPLGQRVPQNPPIDRLSEMHNRMTYDNLAPQIHKIFAMLPGEQREAAKSFTDTSIINMQDRMLSIGRIIDQLKKNGGVITTENDTYLRQTLFPSQTDAHLTANEKAFYQPLENAIKGLDVTQADYNALITHFGADSPVGKILKTYPKAPKFALAELYLYAQHAQERNAEMRRRNAVWQRDSHGRVIRDPHGDPVPVRPLAYEEGSGMSDPLAQQVLNWFNGTPARMREFSDLTNQNSVRSRMRALITSTNDVRVDGGLNPDFRIMRYADGSRVDAYDDYVPLRGMIAEAHDEHDEVTKSFAKTGRGFNIRGKEDYAAVGREEHLARDIISTAMMQNQEAIVRAGKNKVGQSFLKLIQDNPTEMARVAEIMQMPKTKYVYERRLGKVVQRTDNTVHQDPNVLKVKVEGNQVYIKMKDARVVQALGDKSGLGNAGIGPLMKALLGLNRWMASMRTSYNPEFLINNFVKDFGAGMANLSEYEMAGLRREVGSSVFPALAGIRRALRSGDTTSEWAKVHEEYRLHGGHTAFYGIRELDDTIQRINKEFSADMSGPAGKVKKTFQSLGGLVEDYNLVIENGTRLATYKALRDRYLAMSGDPNNAQNQKRAKEMAAFAAKNLTVNFNMGGEWKNNLNVFYLFYNASLQGSMALLNPLIRSGKLRRAWMGIVGIGVLQDVIMSMLSPEDDDGEKQYDKLDDYIVEHNAIWMDPFGITERGYFKLPLPYMLNSVYNIGRMASKMARGKATLGDFMSSAGMSFIESTNPLGGMNTFANWVAPTLLDPFIDLTVNEKFTGTPIMPAENPFGRSEVRSQRYWNNTNPAFVSIADWMSTLTGRESDYIGGAVEVSPNQIDYAVDFLFGGVGPFLARSAWFAGGAVNPVWREEMSATDIPFVRKLYGSITSKNDQQRYMKGKDQVMRVLDSLKAARKDGDNEAYMEIMRNHPAEYKAAARINTIENARRRVSSQIKKVRDSKKLTEEKKTELIKAYKEKQDMLVGKGNEVLAGID